MELEATERVRLQVSGGLLPSLGMPQDATEGEGGRQRHEARCLRPTRPRAVFMLLIVRAPIERLAIAVGASEIDRQRSAGLSIVLMEGPKIVFPFSIALRFVPARKQVTNVHCSTLYDRHPGERTDLPASECPVDERRGSPGSF